MKSCGLEHMDSKLTNIHEEEDKEPEGTVTPLKEKGERHSSYHLPVHSRLTPNLKGASMWRPTAACPPAPVCSQPSLSCEDPQRHVCAPVCRQPSLTPVHCSTSSCNRIHLERKFSFPFLRNVSIGCCVYVCAPCACSVLGSQERGPDPVGLKLQMVVSHHLGGSNQTWALWRSVLLASEPSLSGPSFPFLMNYFVGVSQLLKMYVCFWTFPFDTENLP